jgi:hypothetical protein
MDMYGQRVLQIRETLETNTLGEAHHGLGTYPDLGAVFFGVSQRFSHRCRAIDFCASLDSSWLNRGSLSARTLAPESVTPTSLRTLRNIYCTIFSYN